MSDKPYEQPVIVDVEWDPADGDRLLCLGWMLVGDYVAKGATTVTDELAGFLADPRRPVVGWTKADYRWFLMHGYELAGPQFDAQVAAWVLDENQDLDLATAYRKYGGVEMDKRLVRRDNTVYFRCDNGEQVLIADAPLHELQAYNLRDVEATKPLFLELWKRLEAEGWRDYYLQEEVPFTSVLSDTEAAGMGVDVEASEKLRAQLESEVGPLEAGLRESGRLPDGFNLNSPPQLAAYLFNKRFELTDVLDVDPDAIAQAKDCLAGDHDGCLTVEHDCVCHDTGGCGVCCAGPTEKDDVHVADLLAPKGFRISSIGRTKVHGSWWLEGRGLAPTKKKRDPKTGEVGKFPTTESPALRLKHPGEPWIEQLLEYRKRTKVISTYLIPIRDKNVGGRIYARFNQTGTKTGRLSSSDPNMQNMPSHGDGTSEKARELGEAVRRLFVGDLVVADYSQLEPRLMAHFSLDPLLLDIYRNNRDTYVEIATRILGRPPSPMERDLFKRVYLGSQYGAMSEKIWELVRLGGHPITLDEANDYRLELRRSLRTLFQWKDSVMAYAKQHGYVTTLAGRRRRLKYQFSGHHKNIGYGERQAVNAVVQGSAGDVVRRVMVKQHDLLRGQLRLLAQVHDELVNDKGPLFNETTLVDYQYLGENEHGFKLNVPLVFEPACGPSWFEAKEAA